jgi:hypothetical protein
MPFQCDYCLVPKWLKQTKFQGFRRVSKLHLLYVVEVIQTANTGWEL